MISKEHLKNDLKAAGLLPEDTLLIHSSMKSIGPVDGGADTVLDALQEYFSTGLVVFPTLTWRIGYKYTPEAGTEFSVKDSPTDVGILAELFRKRPGVIRSLHPTHSVAAYGPDAQKFTAGHELVKTSLAWDSPWGRLYDRNGKILFIGVGIACNTFLHAVEEKFPVPDLMDGIIHELTVIDEKGRRIPCNIQRHVGEHSHQYALVKDLLFEMGAAKMMTFGNANCYLLDARKTADAVWELLRSEPLYFSAEYQTRKRSNA